MTRLSLVVLVLALCGCFDDHHHRDDLSDDGGPPVGGCAAITSCAQCTPVRGCGWCTIGGVGRCARGPSECSLNGAYSWTWVPEGCPGAGDGGMNEAGASDAAGAGANFKSASTDNVVAEAGVTNLVALSLTAPAAGSVWVSASGTCTVVAALPVAIGAVVSVETDPHASTQMAGAAGLDYSLAPDETHAFSVTRTLPAHAGVNSFYVNFDNPSNGGRLSCSAAMTAFFTPQQLP